MIHSRGVDNSNYPVSLQNKSPFWLFYSCLIKADAELAPSVCIVTNNLGPCGQPQRDPVNPCRVLMMMSFTSRRPNGCRNCDLTLMTSLKAKSWFPRRWTGQEFEDLHAALLGSATDVTVYGAAVVLCGAAPPQCEATSQKRGIEYC